MGIHMKILCFKFHQNRAVNEEFDFWGSQILSGGPEGSKMNQFKKIKKALHRTMFSTHTENLSILAQLKSVYKSGELIRLLGGGVLGLPREVGGLI